MDDFLYLVWYEKENNILNLIAKLTFNNGIYTFEYLNFNNSDLQLFSKNGLFYGFEDINEIYTSDKLFPTIANRLPSKKRSDYLNILSDYNLSANSDDIELLKKTKGLLSTDNFMFVSDNEYNNLKKEIKRF